MISATSVPIHPFKTATLFYTSRYTSPAELFGATTDIWKRERPTKEEVTHAHFDNTDRKEKKQVDKW